MAKSPIKPEASTEAAYAAAASKAPAKKPAKPALRKPAAKPVAAKATAPEPVLAKVEEALPPVAEAVVPEVLAAEPEPVAEAAPIAAEDISIAPAEAEAVASPINAPFQFLKDIPMTNDFTDTMTGAVNEMQARLQSAYDKSTTVVTEMTDLAKGNVEALVESTKLVAAGVQDMGKTYADEAKAAYETATADIKEMAAIKSPTELFQLQGKIMRRNFDMFIAATSKSTDAALKLANDAMAPISGRVNVTAEKLSQVAA